MTTLVQKPQAQQLHNRVKHFKQQNSKLVKKEERCASTPLSRTTLLNDYFDAVKTYKGGINES